MQERAFSTIQSVVAAEQYAEENGISLTEAQKTEAHTMAGGIPQPADRGRFGENGRG